MIGNHEEKHLRYRRHEKNRILTGKKNPMNPLSGKKYDVHVKLNDDDWSYIEKMPYFIRFSSRWVVVHAGLQRGLSIEDQDPNVLCRMRFVSEDGKMKGLRGDLSQPPGTMLWTSMWDQENVVYGHFVHDLEHSRIDVNGQTLMYGIDTGCCFGGKLTAFTMFSRDNMRTKIELFWTQAKEKYYETRLIPPVV